MLAEKDTVPASTRTLMTASVSLAVSKKICFSTWCLGEQIIKTIACFFL